MGRRQIRRLGTHNPPTPKGRRGRVLESWARDILGVPREETLGSHAEKKKQELFQWRSTKDKAGLFTTLTSAPAEQSACCSKRCSEEAGGRLLLKLLSSTTQKPASSYVLAPLSGRGDPGSAVLHKDIALEGGERNTGSSSPERTKSPLLFIPSTDRTICSPFSWFQREE